MAYLKCLRNVSASTIPDGKTVTPTDDISIWLACGGRSETYTTLSQVLADSTCLSALINDNNAVDYLVRSTTWASDVCGDSGAMAAIGGNNYASNTLLADSTWCSAICNSTYFESVLNVKVPTMTSATTPSGVVSASSVYSINEGWFAFDSDFDSSPWTSSAIPAWLEYEFTQNVKIHKIVGKNDTSHFIRNYIVQCSNDNSNCIDVYSSTSNSGSRGDWSASFDNNYDVKYWRLYVSTTSSNTNVSIDGFQFYGRADV